MLCKTGSELSNSSGIVLNVITYAIPHPLRPMLVDFAKEFGSLIR
jgi:hypothetical protein